MDLGWDAGQVLLKGQPVQEAWGTACHILGYWFDVDWWAVQNEKLTSSLLTILAQVLACGLSMCNKVHVWN